jgi:hypothetical protein
MLGLLVGAALLGIIIAIMEDGEFPGWFRVTLCSLAALLPTGIVNAFLPNVLSFVGAIVGAVVGGFAISALCGMSVQRASIAAGIWLVLIIGVSFVFQLAV